MNKMDMQWDIQEYIYKTIYNHIVCFRNVEENIFNFPFFFFFGGMFMIMARDLNTCAFRKMTIYGFGFGMSFFFKFGKRCFSYDKYKIDGHNFEFL